MKQILIVEDDIPIGNGLEEALRKEGYGVWRAYSGTEALLLLDGREPDLILLDLMLPGVNGEELLPRLKGIPTIVVSAKIDPEEKAELLLGGAADYVTKPFYLKELLARVAVQLRRGDERQGREHLFACDGLTLDADTHIVSCGDRQVRLTRTECAILKLFLQNPDRVIPKSNLLDRISQDTPDCTENSLKIHVSNLRRKLRDISGRDYLEAVWGIGFKLRVS